MLAMIRWSLFVLTLLMVALTSPAQGQAVVFEDPLNSASSADVGGGWTEIGEFAGSTTIGSTRWGPAVLRRTAGWIAFDYTRPTSPIPWASANARPAVVRTFAAVANADVLRFDFAVHANGRIAHDVGIAPANGIAPTGDIRAALSVSNALLVRVSQTDAATANGTIAVVDVVNGAERIFASAPFAGGFRTGMIYTVTLSLGGGTLTVTAAGGATVTRSFNAVQPAAPVATAFVRDLEGGISNAVAWADTSTYTTRFANLSLRTAAAPAPLPALVTVFEDRPQPATTSSTVGNNWAEINELAGSVTVGSTRFGPAQLERVAGHIGFTYQRPTSPVPWNTANARPALTRSITPTPLAALNSVSFDFSPHANGRLAYDLGVAPADGTLPVPNDLRLGLRATNGIFARISQTDAATANGTISAISVNGGVETTLASIPWAGGFRPGVAYTASLRFDGELTIAAFGGATLRRTFAAASSDAAMTQVFLRDHEAGLSNAVPWSDPATYTTRFANVVVTARQAASPTTITLLPLASPPIVGDAPLISWQIRGPDGRVNQLPGTVRVALSDGFNQESSAGNGAMFIRTFTAGQQRMTLSFLDPAGAVVATTEGVINVSKQPVKFWIISMQTLPSLPGQRRVSVIFGLARSKDVGGPTPTGLVTFASENGATCAAETPISNECEIVIPNASGRVQISGIFPGDANYQAATLVRAHVLPDEATPVTPARVNLFAPNTATAGAAVSLAFAVENATTLTAPVRVWAFPGGLLCSAPASVGSCPVTFAAPGSYLVHAEFVDTNPAKAANSSVQTINVGGVPVTNLPSGIVALEAPPAVVGRQFSPRAITQAPPGATVELRLGTAACTASAQVGTCSLPVAAAGTQSVTATLMSAAGAVLATRSMTFTATQFSSAAALTVTVEMVRKDPTGAWVAAKCVQYNAAAEAVWVGYECANRRTLFEGTTSGIRVGVVNRGNATSAATAVALETPRGRVNVPISALAPGASAAIVQPLDIEGLAFRRKVLPTQWSIGSTAGSTAATVAADSAWQPLPGSDYDNLYTVTAGLPNQDAAVTEFAVVPRPVLLVHGWVGSPATFARYPMFLAEAYRPTVGEWIALPAQLRLGGAGKFLAGYFAEVPVGTCGDPSCATAGELATGLFANATLLGQHLAEWRARLGFTEAFAVAHSAGGLVLRAYIDGDAPLVQGGVIVGTSGRLPYAMPIEEGRPIIRRAITIGTPHLGSPCGLTVTGLRVVNGWNAAESTPTWLQATGTINLGGMLAPAFITQTFNPIVNDTRGVPFFKIGTPGGPLGLGLFWDDVRDANTALFGAKVAWTIASTRAPMTSVVAVGGTNIGWAAMIEATLDAACPGGDDSDGVVTFDSATFGDREFRARAGHLRQTESRDLFRNLVLPRLIAQ